MSNALSTKTTKTSNLLNSTLATKLLGLIHNYLLKPRNPEKTQVAARLLFYLSSVNPDVVIIKITSVILSTINDKDSDELVNQVTV